MTSDQEPPHGPRRRKAGGPFSLALAPAATAVDPVCGMTVDPAAAPASHVHDGQTYYFCCPSCRAKFAADPARYLHGDKEPMAPAGAGATVDPVCGMTVDPARAAGSAEHGGRTYHFCSTHC